MSSWTAGTVAGKRVDVYEPPHKPRFGVVFLHGVGLETLSGNAAWTGVLEALDLACLCPHGQESWWTDRICPDFDAALTAERHILNNVVPHFEQRWGLKPLALGITGISMGGQGALRIAFKHPDVFPAVSAVASAIDYHELYGSGRTLDAMYDSKEQCRQDTATLHIHPTKSPPHIFFCIDPDDANLYRGNDRLHEKLTALGIPHTVDLTTRAGGHTWAYFDRMAGPALRFVHAGLEHESRRLL